MANINPISKAVAHIPGGRRIAAELCGVSVEAIRKWIVQGHLPRTEWTGETRYSDILSRACGRKVTRTALMSSRPKRRAA